MSSTATITVTQEPRHAETISEVVQLNRIIPPLLSSNPPNEYVRDFVYVCQGMAIAYLRVKVKRGRFDPNTFGISLNDLALDCVADLFERDSNNRFVELTGYFGRIDYSSFCQSDWLGATRRLVFSKVNEGLFRLYKEHDRSLSNTIRNLKNSLKFSDTMFGVARGNEVWVQLLDPESSDDGLPLLPPELIEGRLLAQSDHHRNLPELLDAFAELLQEQDLYQKQYPLVGLALILRSLMFRTSPITEDIDAQNVQLTQDEVKDFLNLGILRTKASMRPSYVEKGKLGEDIFNTYFDCIRDILEEEYVYGDGSDCTYFETLRNRMGTLSEANYRRHHRVYLEYLSKLTRKDFLEIIKNELDHG